MKHMKHVKNNSIDIFINNENLTMREWADLNPDYIPPYFIRNYGKAFPASFHMILAINGGNNDFKEYKGVD